MPDVGKAVRADAATTLTTVYTTPAATKFYIKSINVNNPTDVSQAFTLTIGGKDLARNLNIPKYGGARDGDTHVLEAGGVIQFAASSADVDIVIDGVEETA